MNENEQRSRIDISFKKSSTKDGGTGYEIYIGEGAEQREADRLFDLAVHLRARAAASLKERIV